MYSIAVKVSDCIRPDACSDMVNHIIESCRGTSVEFQPMPYDVAKLKDMCEEVTLGKFEYENDEDFMSLLESLDFELAENFGCSLIAMRGDSIFELEEDDTIYLVDDLGEVEWVDED